MEVCGFFLFSQENCLLNYKSYIGAYSLRSSLRPLEIIIAPPPFIYRKFGALVFKTVNRLDSV
jgi:hypothetical protein